jgi:hypothetical protein
MLESVPPAAGTTHVDYAACGFATILAAKPSSV